MAYRIDECNNIKTVNCTKASQPTNQNCTSTGNKELPVGAVSNKKTFQNYTNICTLFPASVA